MIHIKSSLFNESDGWDSIALCGATQKDYLDKVMNDDELWENLPICEGCLKISNHDESQLRRASKEENPEVERWKKQTRFKRLDD
jgi:hypothetical protein